MDTTTVAADAGHPSRLTLCNIWPFRSQRIVTQGGTRHRCRPPAAPLGEVCDRDSRGERAADKFKTDDALAVAVPEPLRWMLATGRHRTTGTLSAHAGRPLVAVTTPRKISVCVATVSQKPMLSHLSHERTGQSKTNRALRHQNPLPIIVGFNTVSCDIVSCTSDLIPVQDVSGIRLIEEN